MLKVFTLKNGIKVATYSIPQMRSIFLSQSIKAGSVFDSEQTSGTAHFMEHLLVQGTPSYPTVEALSSFMEGIAGSYNAATGRDTVKFYASAPSRYIEEILKISGEVFFEPIFNPNDLERERGAILQEIHQRQDSDWYKKFKFWAQVRFKAGHPFLFDGGGEEDVIKKLTRDDLVNFWQRFFHPKSTYLVIVGGIDQKNIKKQVEKSFSKYNSSKTAPSLPKIGKDQMSKKTVAIRNDLELKTCYIDLSFPSISSKEKVLLRVTQIIARSILGNLRSSRLHRLLRQQRGLVYSVGLSGGSYETFGYIDIFTQASAENLDEVLSLLVSELKSFLEFGPIDQEVTFAVNYHINKVLMTFDHPSSIAEWVEDDLMWENRIFSPEEYAKIIEKVDKKMIIEFVKKYWDLSKINLTVQGPIENSKENVEKYSEMVEQLSSRA